MKNRSVYYTTIIFSTVFFLLPNPLFLSSVLGQCVEQSNGAIDIQGASAPSGEMVSVTVSIQNSPNEVTCFGFDVAYDSDTLEYTGYDKGGCVEDFFYFGCNEIEPGTLRCGGYEALQNTVDQDDYCSVVHLEFVVIEENCHTALDGTEVSLKGLVDDIASWTATSGCFSCICSADTDCPEGFTCQDGSCIEGDEDPPQSTSSTTSSSTTTSPPASTSTSTPGGGGSPPAATTTSTVPESSTTTSAVVTTTTTSVFPDNGGENPETSSTTTIVEPLPSSTTTTAAHQQQCLLEQLLGENNENKLELFRRYRNSRLAKTPEGLALVYLYYAHGNEVMHLLSQNYALMDQARDLALDISSSLTTDTQKPEKLLLNSIQKKRLRRILEALHEHSGPGLKKALVYLQNYQLL